MNDRPGQDLILESAAKLGNIDMTATGMGMSMVPQNLGEIISFGVLMSRTSIAVPKHLRENAGACTAVAMRAFAWAMDPFAVADKTYLVNDRLAYEAQLVAAVIHLRAPIQARPTYEYVGEGATRQCIVKATTRDGIERVYTSPPIGKIRVQNSPLWKDDPDQQLGYYAIRAWGRRYCPEVIMGVYTPDEMIDHLPERERAASFADMEERAVAALAVDNSEDDGQEGAASAAQAAGARAPSPSPPVQQPQAKEEGLPSPQQMAGAPRAAPELDLLASATPASSPSAEETSSPSDIAEPTQSGSLPTQSDPAAAGETYPDLAAFADALAGAQDWPDGIAPALRTLYGSADWEAAGEPVKARARALAYERLVDLAKGGYRFDMLGDVNAYRCYIEYETDPAALEGNRRAFDMGKIFEAMKTSHKVLLDKAFVARIEKLRSGR